MINLIVESEKKHVAPFTGAWIEILKFKDLPEEDQSLPSRGRGLK